MSLEGALDVPALGRAFGEILRRHESLRTAFGVHEGEPVQVISGVPDVALEVVDLAALTTEEAGARLEQRALEESRRPFDLSRGPLVRAMLLRQDAHRHVLLLTMHHIVSDGWSMGIFMREMAALYEAFHAGRPSPLPELPVQYADYAAWQRGWLKGDALEAQLSYWREQLRDTPRLLELPTDHVRPTVRTHRAGTVPTEFPQALSEKLQALSQQEGATLYMTLLAGFQVLLSRYSVRGTRGRCQRLSRGLAVATGLGDPIAMHSKGRGRHSRDAAPFTDRLHRVIHRSARCPSAHAEPHRSTNPRPHAARCPSAHAEPRRSTNARPRSAHCPSAHAEPRHSTSARPHAAQCP